MDNPEKPVFQLHVAPREKQNRWTVFFRLILLIPHFFVLYGLFIGATFLTFLGWFVAIFTGRNPFHEYTASVLSWYARVVCYYQLLTGKYPPFSMKVDGELPVATVMERGLLGRVSVLFRIILVIPALIVQWIIGAGLFVLSVVAWLITLVRGTLPQSMHNGFQATIRFQFRILAYLFLLQNRYPRGLFGDKDDVALSLQDTSAGALPPPPHEPTNDEDSDQSEPRSEELSRLDVVDSDESAAKWQLVVTKGGRRILYSAFVLGVLLLTVQFVFPGHAFRETSNQSTDWSFNYRGVVSNLNDAIIGSESSMFSTSPNWHVVRVDCGLISQDLSQLETVPQYPVQSTGRHLLLAVGVLREAEQSCSTAVSGQNVTQLSGTAEQFLAGSDLLQVFLDKSGTIFVF